MTALAATPALLLDIKKMRANVARMRAHLAQYGVPLRLHGKTCKNIDIAGECGVDAGIAVSTLAEAEYYFSSGIGDIIYAVGITPQKLARVLEVRLKGGRVAILADSPATAAAIARFGRAQAHSFDVLIEIDCDGHRSGIKPADPALEEIAAMLVDAGQNMDGVLTHAGSAYELPGPGPAAFRRLATTEAQAARDAAARLAAAGFPCGIVSIGSTPTALFGDDLAGITEVRAGVFPFMDCTMAALNVCETCDIALSVLCTVIGTRDGAIITDAGWSALSLDTGADFAQFGYGLVCGRDGRLLPGLKVHALNQEHGIIRPDPGCKATGFAPGDMLRILPVHACATAASFDNYNVLEDDRLIARWPRCRGW